MPLKYALKAPTSTPANTSRHAASRLALAIALSLSSLAGTAPVHAETSVQAAHNFHIEASALDAALVRFGQRSGVLVSVSGDVSQNKQTRGLDGHYPVEQGLQVLLQGTGLRAVRQENGSYVVEAPSQTATTLPPVKISADAAEQTGSAAEGYKVSETSGVGPWQGRSLQDTPYSMSVMSDELIENAFITDMDQIAKINPLVQLGRSSSFDDTQVPIMRGFGNFSQIVDGMRLSSPPQGISFEEVERIEVLSGLSGFLYGGGNVGGTVNYVLKRPTEQRLTQLTVGNYGGSQYFAHADLGGPIDQNGTFGYRLNFMHQDGETSVDGQDKKESLVSGAFDWHVTDDFLVQLEASHREYEMQSPSASFDFRNASDHPNAYDSNKSYTPEWNHFDNKTDRISLRANWDLNDAFSVRAAYLHKEHDWYINDTVTTFPRGNDDGTFRRLTVYYSPGERTNGAAHLYVDTDFQTGSIESSRDFRRLVCLSQATMADSSSWR